MILSANDRIIHRGCFDRVIKALNLDGHISFIILYGQPEGIGKRTLAKQAALALTKGTNILNLIDERKISVSQIREIQEWAFVCPFTGMKVLLLYSDNIAEASYNALLKILEEPPKYLRIVLVINNKTVPITISSRAMRIIVPPLSVEQVEEIFVAKGMLRTKAKALAVAADGSIKNIESLMDIEGHIGRVEGALKYLLNRQVEMFLSVASKWGDNELRVLNLITICAKRWQFRPFAMVILPLDIIITLSKLRVEDIDKILGIFERDLRRRLKIFAFAEIVSIGRKERF